MCHYVTSKHPAKLSILNVTYRRYGCDRNHISIPEFC